MRGYPDIDPVLDRRAWGILAGRSRTKWLRSPHQTDTAVEMPAPWKPQTGFHRALEISRRTRDSHIPTSRLLFAVHRKQEQNGPDRLDSAG